MENKEQLPVEKCPLCGGSAAIPWFRAQTVTISFMNTTININEATAKAPVWLGAEKEKDSG